MTDKPKQRRYWHSIDGDTFTDENCSLAEDEVETQSIEVRPGDPDLDKLLEAARGAEAILRHIDKCGVTNKASALAWAERLREALGESNDC